LTSNGRFKQTGLQTNRFARAAAVTLPAGLFADILSMGLTRLKARDDQSHIDIGSERAARISIERNRRKPAIARAFVKLSSRQRAEIIELVERLAGDPAPFPGGINGRPNPR
jgi:hypothetical protein